MKIKIFNFPTFEDWNKTHEYEQKIGDYTCVIKTFSWGRDETKYIAALANSDYPSNIYVRKIYSNYVECRTSDEEKLKDWYELVTIDINKKWESFILETYLSAIDNL